MYQIAYPFLADNIFLMNNIYATTIGNVLSHFLYIFSHTLGQIVTDIIPIWMGDTHQPVTKLEGDFLMLYVVKQLLP